MRTNDHTTLQHIIVLAGPTASGKTALAIRMALQLNAEIISADSRQFYREMTIGTAKPTAAELAEVPHHLIDYCSVVEHLSAGAFEQLALALIADISARGKRIIVVGGSGLYLQALLFGLNTFPEIPQQIKAQVTNIYVTNGLEGLQERLKALDPVCFARIDQHNPVRLRRALEVCLSTGEPYSSFLQPGRVGERPFKAHQILLEPPRDILYDRINRRVDDMIAAGLEEEVRSLLPYQNLSTLHTIGYEEWFPYFEGKCDRAEVIDKIKQHSRNYAKRQGTWFRKYGEWTRYMRAEDVLGDLERYY